MSIHRIGQVQKHNYENIMVKEELTYQIQTGRGKKRQILSRMDKKYVQLTPNDYEEETELKESFDCIQQHFVEYFASNWEMKGLLKYIKDISFPNMMTLDLTNAGLESLQTLPRIQMPLLQQFWVDKNHLVSLKPLRKVSLPSIKTIAIKNNKAVEFCSLSSADLSSLQKFSVESKQDLDGEDLRCLAKLNAQRLRKIQFFQGTKIQQTKLRRTIALKYFGVSENNREL